MSDFLCNVLIMGKTGTGKSSLLNYVCGQNLAKVGAGKPVTGEGLYEYEVQINAQDVKIFDSWGIEAGKVDRWNFIIEESLKDHGIQKPMEEWFHSVIYCIQAGGGRVEDVDSEIIKKFLRDGYHLTIVLTKADQIDEDDEKQMKKVILQEIKGAVKAEKQGILKVVSTCAEEKKTRSGMTIPFGKEDVQKAILDGWRETIIERMPKHVIACLCEVIDCWAYELKTTVTEEEFVSGVAAWNKDIYKNIAEGAKEVCKQIQDEILPDVLKESIEACHKANASLKEIFNLELNDSIFDEDILANTESKIWFSFKSFISGLFIIPTIANLIKDKLKGCVETEEYKLCDFINKLSEKMKSEMIKYEAEISKIIGNSLK